ncbi:MAG: methionine gamma-lyase family protein [Bacilli bacterium]|nr:methionine gamma-lyase family protein [Bacilli bacterium]
MDNVYNIQRGDFMYKEFGIDEKTIELINSCEEECKEEFTKIDTLSELNSLKVLNAFHKNEITESCFNETTGYGYNDLGRDKIEKVFRDIFKSEDALVRSQFISGSHALNVCLFALLRPGDLLLSITGKPYDTLDEVIGIKDNPSSLKSYNIKYDQIDLVNDDFDYSKIEEYLNNNKVKVIEIQRSKGYSTRKSISIKKLKNVIKTIRNIDKDVIIMIDNCYCEFVSATEPIEEGADIMVGSLIKNLGGGIAPNGAYIAGRHDLIELCAERLTLPGEGREVGPSLGINKQILQGIYMAPSVVTSALKTAVLTSRVLEKLGYQVEPKYNDERVDIVQNITFGNPDDLIEFTRGIQEGSAIDSNARVEAWDMPGYSDKVVMASGSFTQGSSIELSCDGPIREPYIAYMQGSLTYPYGKLGLMKAVQKIMKGGV